MTNHIILPDNSSVNIGLVDAELGASLISDVGSTRFGSTLLSAAQQYAPVEEVFAYRIIEGEAPDMLASCSMLQDASDRAERYLKRFYSHDPAVQTRLDTAIGNGFTDCVRDVQIIPYDYRSICFEKPKFAEKICFGWRGETHTHVLSFYRKDYGGQEDIRLLTSLANISLAALARQSQQIASPQISLFDNIERRLQTAYPMFTPREREICAHSLAGLSSSKIAEKLGIKPNSVYTYRQRAYQRVGASCANDLLKKLL